MRLVIARHLLDGENETELVAMIAVGRSHLPRELPGPIGAARVGYVDGEYVLNPTQAQIKEGQLDLVVAGSPNAVMMVESEAKELSEDVMLRAVMFGHEASQKVCGAIISLAEKAAKDPWELDLLDDSSETKKKLKDIIGKDLEAAYKLTNKQERQTAINDARTKAREAFADLEASDPAASRHLEAGEEGSRPTSSAAPSSRTAAGSTGATPRPSARSRRWSASCRGPTVQLCSRGAKRRRSAPPRSGPRTASR